MLGKCNVPDTICDKPDTGSQNYAPCMADSADTDTPKADIPPARAGRLTIEG